MKHAPVSVVIPTFNRRDIVPDAIDSALAQTLSPAQVIVIDDGSRDDTAASLRRYAGRIRYHRQPNAGLSAVRNTGIRLADEPFVAFLDDDDVWHPRKLELQMRAFQRRPDLALLGAEQFDWPTAEFPPVPGDALSRLRGVTWEQLVVRTLIPVSSVVVRTEVLECVGDFDVTLRSSEDRDFFLRVAEVARIGMLDVPLSGYRDTAGSMCKNPAGREEAMRRILGEIDARGGWRGRWLLRHKAYSYMHRVCCDAHARAGNHGAAVARAVKSMAWYPLPYTNGDARMWLERPRRATVNLLRLMRLKARDAGAAPHALLREDALARLRTPCAP